MIFFFIQVTLPSTRTITSPSKTVWKPTLSTHFSNQHPNNQTSCFYWLLLLFQHIKHLLILYPVFTCPCSHVASFQCFLWNPLNHQQLKSFLKSIHAQFMYPGEAAHWCLSLPRFHWTRLLHSHQGCSEGLHTYMQAVLHSEKNSKGSTAKTPTSDSLRSRHCNRWYVFRFT